MALARYALTLALPLSLFLNACGDRTGEEPGPREGTWDVERISAEVGADQAPVLATSGDDALLLTATEDGTIRSYRSTDGGPFEAGEPLSTELDYLLLGGAVVLPDGAWFVLGSGGSTEVKGDTELSHQVKAFRSDDGLAWEQVEVTGFADAVDVNDLALVDGRVVVAGAYRRAEDPSMGGFEAHVWTSTEGVAFAEVDLPGVLPPRGYRNDSYATHLAVTGDRVVAAGGANNAAAVWTSDDGAATWSRVESPALADVYALSGLAGVDGALVAGVGAGSTTALRSTDRGDTWAPVEGLPAASEEAGWAPLWAGGGRAWTLTGVRNMSWSDPAVCYADLDQCGRLPAPRVVSSPDGSTWTAVELPGEPDEIVATVDGRTLVLGADSQGFFVATLPAGAAPPKPPALTEPETVELVTVGEGETPEVRVRYHAPMYVHCGMTWFWFGDATWRRTDNGPDLETGAGDGAPDDWPLAQQTLYGYAVLTDGDHLDYSIGDEVVATYERADGAPGCD